MTGTIELSEYVIDAIADAVVKKMQEPILDKVLEDIKTEIEKRADDYFASGDYDGDLYNGAYKDALYWCFGLIDKYKAESEVQDADSD